MLKWFDLMEMSIGWFHDDRSACYYRVRRAGLPYFILLGAN